MAHRPTEKKRNQVKVMIANGISQALVSEIIGVDKEVLLECYSAEIQQSVAIAVSKVGGKVLKQAQEGHFPSQKLYLECMAGWNKKASIENNNNTTNNTINLIHKEDYTDPIKAAQSYKQLIKLSQEVPFVTSD